MPLTEWGTKSGLLRRVSLRLGFAAVTVFPAIWKPTRCFFINSLWVKHLFKEIIVQMFKPFGLDLNWCVPWHKTTSVWALSPSQVALVSVLHQRGVTQRTAFRAVELAEQVAGILRGSPSSPASRAISWRQGGDPALTSKRRNWAWLFTCNI